MFIIPNAHSFQTDITQKYNDIFSSKILSEEDEKLSMLIISKKNVSGKVQIDLFKIQNKTLLGHIYAQKFLHPNCYTLNI